ncbi:MAG: nucleotidyltransferase substrate binding protein [Kiritimatiellia bacterium]
MNNPDVRWRQRLSSFRKAFSRLKSAVELTRQRKLSELEKQGFIQAFEFTHELAWNVLKNYLEDQGVQGIIGSKGATREAFKNGLISDGETWMDMIASRNQTSHTYNQETADEIVGAISSRYFDEFQHFLTRFTDLEGKLL